jgi:hypothetical protein
MDTTRKESLPVMALLLLLSNATTTVTTTVAAPSGYQSLLDLLTNPIAAYFLGVLSLVLGEATYENLRKWRNNPRIRMVPYTAPDESGVITGLRIFNDGRTPLLECSNRVAIYLPQLVVDGKLTRFLDRGADIRDIPWIESEEDREEVRSKDLFPHPPDILAIPLATFMRANGFFFGNFLADEGDPRFICAPSSALMFSSSDKEAKPTKDFKCLFIVWIYGKTTLDHYEQSIRRFLLTIPGAGDYESCDFSKAAFTKVSLAGSRLDSFARSQGLNPRDVSSSRQ